MLFENLLGSEDIWPDRSDTSSRWYVYNVVYGYRETVEVRYRLFLTAYTQFKVR